MSLADHKSIQRGRVGEVIQLCLNITYVAHPRHPYIESLPTLWVGKTYCVYEQMTNCDCWEYNVWVTKSSTPSEYTFTIISSTKYNGNQIYVAWWIVKLSIPYLHLCILPWLRYMTLPYILTPNFFMTRDHIATTWTPFNKKCISHC